MCAKKQNIEEGVPIETTPKGMFLTKSFSDSIGQNKDLALEMSNDADWRSLKKYSDACLSILIAKDIDLYDESNYDSETFYLHLGEAAQDYKDNMTLGKKHAKAFMNNFFPNVNQCSDCTVVDPAKKLAYAKALDNIRQNKRNQKGKISIATEAVPELPEAPNCWTLELFACGGLCAMTIEFPPAFALCMALCITEYCEIESN